MNRTRIILADDHPFILLALRQLVAAEAGFELVGEATTGLEALSLVRATTPDVAVIDIGSNSIKVLVAARDAAGALQSLKYRTIDARISAGISQDSPRLSEDGMARGLDAIRSLLVDAAEFSPRQIILVATSAVRDAQNGAEFRARVQAATGHEIRVLSGDEEANLIGRGLT